VLSEFPSLLAELTRLDDRAEVSRATPSAGEMAWCCGYLEPSELLVKLATASSSSISLRERSRPLLILTTGRNSKHLRRGQEKQAPTTSQARRAHRAGGSGRRHNKGTHDALARHSRRALARRHARQRERKHQDGIHARRVAASHALGRPAAARPAHRPPEPQGRGRGRDGALDSRVVG